MMLFQMLFQPAIVKTVKAIEIGKAVIELNYSWKFVIDENFWPLIDTLTILYAIVTLPLNNLNRYLSFLVLLVLVLDFHSLIILRSSRVNHDICYIVSPFPYSNFFQMLGIFLSVIVRRYLFICRHCLIVNHLCKYVFLSNEIIL